MDVKELARLVLNTLDKRREYATAAPTDRDRFRDQYLDLEEKLRRASNEVLYPSRPADLFDGPSE